MDYLASISTLTALDVALIACAVWRASYALTKESGPFAVFARIRARFPLGGLTTCIKCAGWWIALLFVVLYATPLRPLVIVFGVSGLALMVAAYTGVAHGD